ncbi:DnaJ domain-containing protein [Pelagibacterium montanilacus]|uniref:DnaJ domain-containing protein n=1 Tax=Pelagibacterium montanilacus TaxID=2185280 RepID=UPI000F8D0021|nr:DnaJ domain-containing protein [Pelagibacterium montanilacus]
MIWLVGGGLALVLLVYLYSLFTQGEIRRLVRALRYTLGGLMIAVAAVFGLRGNMMVASVIAMGAAGLLMRGRLGPIDFGGGGQAGPNNASKVKSRYLDMRLDHDTGAVTGEVREGLFRGRDLAGLGPEECWALYDEVGEDPDSQALFESWLDANRKGWRDYFSEHYGMDGEAGPTDGATGGTSGTRSGLSSVEEAYELLGLEPGAGPDQIRAAHRRLMKKVHPDQGGSAFLAARINAAKDLLLETTGRSAR